MDTLEMRVARLERENRLLRRLGAGIVLAVASAGFLGATPNTVSECVRTRELQVVDASGQALVKIGQPADGSTIIGMNDREGNFKAALSVEADGSPNLMLGSSDATQPQVTLAALASGEAGLLVSDQQGHLRAVLSCQANGSPNVILKDARGKTLWQARKK